MDTLGVVESRSIAAGALLADGMLKAADVDLVRAAAICSGRYLIYVSGDLHAVETSVAYARESGRSLAGSFVISHLAPQLLAVLGKSVHEAAGDAAGIVECRTVSSGLAAADCAAKRAAVVLHRFVAGQGINGKSYFVFSGDVSSVEEAAEAARTALGQNLVEAVVIPRPAASVLRALTGGAR